MAIEISIIPRMIFCLNYKEFFIEFWEAMFGNYETPKDALASSARFVCFGAFRIVCVGFTGVSNLRSQ